jgi:hypothetical protein
MTKMPLGAKNDSDVNLKWIFNRKMRQEPIQTKLKDSEIILELKQ